MATARTAKDSAAGTMTEEGSPKVTLTVGGTSIATKTDFRFLWKRPAEQLAGLTQLGSVAKNILTTFYSGNDPVFATISCEASEFLQQNR
jgi:hypothetical protein